MANYYVLLTDYGKSFIANAQAGSQLALTDVVLGDANDQPYLPDSRLTETSLVHQRAKVAVTSIKIVNDTTAEVSAVVPSNVGGFNLHEVGITDSSGKLIYVGNFHGGYRPTLTEGAGGDMELIFTITADNLATVVIESDSGVVTATRDWVTEHFVTKPEFQSHLDADNPHSQYVLQVNFNDHVENNEQEHQGFQQWQDNHLDADNPHSQYVLISDYDAVIAALTKRIDDLESTAGVGTLAGVIEVKYIATRKSQNGSPTSNRTILEQTGLSFGIPAEITLMNPISNAANSYDKTITISLPEEYTPEDYTVSASNSNGTYSISEESKAVIFTTEVNSVRDGEGTVTDTLDTTFKVSMYVK